MKTLKKLIVLLLVVILNVSVVKAEDFLPHIELESFNDNLLTINLWYEGANVSEIEHTIKYDYNYLEIYSVSGNTFSSSITNKESKDNYKIDKVYAVSMQDRFNETYATITFKVKNAFEVNKTMYLRFEDIVATSSSNQKFRSEPLVVVVRRDSVNSVYFYQEYLTDSIERDIWVNDHITNIIVIVVTVIVLVILFLIAPTNFVNRRKTSSSLRKKNKKNTKRKSVDRFDLNPDRIAEIGRNKKVEPKNKLELGDFNPLANNKGKKH